MKEDISVDFWNVFKKTGNIGHYLLYKEVDNKEK